MFKWFHKVTPETWESKYNLRRTSHKLHKLRAKLQLNDEVYMVGPVVLRLILNMPIKGGNLNVYGDYGALKTFLDGAKHVMVKTDSKSVEYHYTEIPLYELPRTTVYTIIRQGLIVDFQLEPLSRRKIKSTLMLSQHNVNAFQVGFHAYANKFFYTPSFASDMQYRQMTCNALTEHERFDHLKEQFPDFKIVRVIK